MLRTWKYPRCFPTLALMAIPAACDAAPLTIARPTIAGGGATRIQTGTLQVTNTIGLPIVGLAISGDRTLELGLWPIEFEISVVPNPDPRGDMNCDGVTNNFDIDPFVFALVDANAWRLTYPNCSLLNGDIDLDGVLNNFDIDPFVQCLVRGCP